MLITSSPASSSCCRFWSSSLWSIKSEYWSSAFLFTWLNCFNCSLHACNSLYNSFMLFHLCLYFDNVNMKSIQSFKHDMTWIGQDRLRLIGLGLGFITMGQNLNFFSHPKVVQELTSISLLWKRHKCPPYIRNLINLIHST